MRSSTFHAGSLALVTAVGFSGTAPGASRRVAAAVGDTLSRLPAAPHVVFACIGTDRSTGDALGPLVGERLLSLGCTPESVLGTLADPLHALNIERRMDELAASAPHACLIAVDAALGRAAHVGALTVRSGGIRPGLGVGKDLDEIGDISITATVNVAGTSMDAQVLQSTRLFLVQKLAQAIGLGLWLATSPILDTAEGHAA